MKTLLEIVASFAILACLTALPAGAGEVLVPTTTVPHDAVLEALDQFLFEYHVFDADLAAVDAAVRSEGLVSLFLANQQLDLEVAEHSLRGEGYRRVLMGENGAQELDPGPVVTFRGHVVGQPDSEVRLTVTPNLLTGSIQTATETLYIDPLSDFVTEAADGGSGPVEGNIVVYRDIDVRDLDPAVCGTRGRHDLRDKLPGARGSVLGDLGPAPATKGGFLTLEVATECDGQYFADYGNPGVFNRINGILNDVEGFIYTSELNLGINVSFQQCWSSIPNDPYTSLSASTSLTQLRNWWNSNNGSVSRDTVHKFSGKNFSGSTIGIAYVGVICNSRSFSYGISQDISGSSSRRRLTAHEIGHNLSAGHDNQAPVCPGVSCNGNGPIMCASIQSGSSSAADDFSSCSADDIDDHISTFGSCI